MEKSNSINEHIDENIPTIALDFTELKNNIVKQSINYLNSHSYHYKYSKKRVNAYLESPKSNEKNIRQLSRYLANVSGIYLNIILYMAKMLTLDYIIQPVFYQGILNKQDERIFLDKYQEATYYMDTFNVKHELKKVLMCLLIDDVYFGYERRKGSVSVLQRFEPDYCRISGYENGLFSFEYDMSYFDINTNELHSFPKEFKTLYEIYKATNNPWQPVNMQKAVCFKLREDIEYCLPLFVALFEDIMDHKDLKDIEIAKNKLDNFKVFFQKIPFKKNPTSEKDFLITLPSVKMFHNNIKSVLPEQIAMISSPMEIKDYSFERKNNTLKNTIEEKKEDIYDSAGVPSGIFNAGNKSSIALKKSIQANESIMFDMLRQFELFFNNRFRNNNNNLSTKNKFAIKVIFPNLSIYNQDDMFDKFLKGAQYGLPKSHVACAMGISNIELQGLSILENKYLNFNEILVPLSSSHTQTQTHQDVGNIEKSDSDLSDKGLETRDRETNENREL